METHTIFLKFLKKFYLFKNVYLYLSYIWAFCLHVFWFMTCVPGACRCQMRALDTLGQELLMVVSHCMSLGNSTQVPSKNRKCSEPQSQLSRLFKIFLLIFFFKICVTEGFSSDLVLQLLLK